MKKDAPFYIQHDNLFIAPVLHYNMETAANVVKAFLEIKPDCVAVELAETMQLKMQHAASRLPDISVVIGHTEENEPLYYLVEPSDGSFEALRCALEKHLPAFCIDLDVDEYPDVRENCPDPYAITRIGLKNYFEAYQKIPHRSHPIDMKRELYMAKRLKELCLSYDCVLFITGMYHVNGVLKHINDTYFPPLVHAKREFIHLATVTEKSCRNILGEFPWINVHYEKARENYLQSEEEFPPDRQNLILQLFKKAAVPYREKTQQQFENTHLRNCLKFARNYALIKGQLTPNLFQIIAAAKGCKDHNFAYEVWELATDYPYLKNIDNLEELNLTPDDIWGSSQKIFFHMKEKSRKDLFFHKRQKNRPPFQFLPPSLFGICSYPPEDVVVEKFGDFLKKKGTQMLTEMASKTMPFTTSIEDGIDTKETIRHFVEKKLYVKVSGKPPGGASSIVVIFDEDAPTEGKLYQEKYPWCATWLGEHTQESDMALYATFPGANVVGPGISRCEYGGFMLTSPPRRLFDIWKDPDYLGCESKAEVLLAAAIDYAMKPVIIYVASKPPRQLLKSFAARFGKKIAYLPIGQLSSITLNKLRIFHVLDGHDRRSIAGEFIF